MKVWIEPLAGPHTDQPRCAPYEHDGEISDSTRAFVMERDSRTCRVCEGPSETPLEVDHVLSRKRGGCGHAHNLQVLCQYHNGQKGEFLSGQDRLAERSPKQIKRAEKPDGRIRRLTEQAEQQGYRLVPTTSWLIVDTLTDRVEAPAADWDVIEQFLNPTIREVSA